MTVSSLGYVGFEVSDQEVWHLFAKEFLGLMPSGSGEGVQKYRIDQRAWRFATHKGEADDVSYLGFEAATHEEFAAIQKSLTDNGIDFRVDNGGLAAEREVSDLLVTRDPAGLQIEIFLGQTERYEIPFQSPASVSGFRTGEQGVGHVVLASNKPDEVRAFYTDVLGFRLSDTIGMKAGKDATLTLEFYHCNGRHHTIALVPVGAPKRMHHFMIEANSLDDVGFALDRLAPCGVTQANTLGKHSNDHMISFYAKTPSGFEVEFGYGGRAVDDETWRVAHHETTSVWGHKPIK